MTLGELAVNRPAPRRYWFLVSDARGTWGEVYVDAANWPTAWHAARLRVADLRDEAGVDLDAAFRLRRLGVSS